MSIVQCLLIVQGSCDPHCWSVWDHVTPTVGVCGDHVTPTVGVCVGIM